MNNASLLEQNAITILELAASSEVGIQIRVEPTIEMPCPSLRAKQVLYRFKKTNADFSSIKIQFCPTDPDTRLWLIKEH